VVQEIDQGQQRCLPAMLLSVSPCRHVSAGEIDRLYFIKLAQGEY
jgi:hypothetical protein